MDDVAAFTNSQDIYIMPTMNPDGFENSRAGMCEGGWRENSNRLDLNRNFPDQFGRQEGAMQPETKV